MTCLDTQRMIIRFINDDLSLEELELFLDHVNSCSECREELEVYYALITAMKQLDEDEILYDDFSMELSAKLEKAQEKIIHSKFAYYRKNVAIVVVILITIFTINWRYIKKEEPVVIVRESNYRLRTVYQHHREGTLEADLQVYITEHQDKFME